LKVVVTGATGLLGRELVKALLARGDAVTVLSRNAASAARAFDGRVTALEWRDPKGEPAPADALVGRDAVVHLLGEPVDQRWTKRARQEIRDSRLLATRNLVEGLTASAEGLGEAPGERPAVLVSQSATGFYGARGDEEVDEDAQPGSDFLAEVCLSWEREAARASELGLRVTTTRTGVVLSPSGGALAKMLPPFRAGIGGPIAGGRQYVPWIHADDVVGGLLFCLDTPDATGPVNLVAPNPTTNRELSKALGRVLGRPAVAPVPELAMKLLYGDMAQIVTTGVRAVPQRLRDLGYRFSQPELEPALRLATGKAD
jgi:uncharacterized protein (TIGR01777 family)